MGRNKYKTRLGKLENKLKTELNNPTPNLEVILQAIADYEKDNLNTIEKLQRDKIITTKRILGGLKSTIRAHGPITLTLISSATKRIYGNLLNDSIQPKLKQEPEFNSSRITWIVFEITIWVSLLIYLLSTK